MSGASTVSWRATGRFVAAIAFVSLAATACGGGSNDNGTVTGTPTTTAAATATTQAAAVTTAPAVSGGALAGTWAGEYTQTKPTSDGGTFSVTFEGSAPDYTGTISIAGSCDPCPITATVKGSTITIGAIGASAITYDGTIAGSSMSGTYSAGQFEGTWKALKA